MSVFDQLAERFAAHGGRVCPDEEFEVEDAMEVAGQALLALAQRRGRGLRIRGLPKWFRRPPKVTRTLAEAGTGEPVETKGVPWGAYWWFAVLQLARDCPGAAIVLPALGISRIEPSAYWWQYFMDELCGAHRAPVRAREGRSQVWGGIARSSADACRFLDRTCCDAPRARVGRGRASEAVSSDRAADKRQGPELDETNTRVRTPDGKWHDVSDESVRMLRALFGAEGRWVKGSAIKSISRPDKARKRMPEPVRNMIESHKRSGYRIPSLLPQ